MSIGIWRGEKNRMFCGGETVIIIYYLKKRVLLNEIILVCVVKTVRNGTKIYCK